MNSMMKAVGLADQTFRPWRLIESRDGTPDAAVCAPAEEWEKPLRWNAEACKMMAAWADFQKAHDRQSGHPEDEHKAAADAWDAHTMGEPIPTRPRVHVMPDIFVAPTGSTVYSDNGGPMLKPACNDGPKVWDYDATDDWEDDPYGHTLLEFADMRRELFALIDQTPFLEWVVVTEAPEYIHAQWPPVSAMSFRRENVTVCVQASNQKACDARLPPAMRSGAGKVVLLAWPMTGQIAPDDLASGENALATVEFQHNGDGDTQEVPVKPRLSAVIVGGDCGPLAKPFNLSAAWDLLRECRAAGVEAVLTNLGSRPTAYAVMPRMAQKPGYLYATLPIEGPTGSYREEWPPPLLEFSGSLSR